MPTVSWRFERERELELGADAVGAGDQHRLAEALADLEQRAEAADAGQHFGPQRALRERLDALDERVAGVDVDAGVAVGKRGTRGGIGRGHRSADRRRAGVRTDGACCDLSERSAARYSARVLCRDSTGNDRLRFASAALTSLPRKPLALRHYAWIVAAAVVVFFGLHWLGPVLTPFLIGAILAYLGTPLVDRAQKRGIPRAWPTLVVVLLMGLLIVGLFFVLVPLVQSEVVLAAQRLPELFEQTMRASCPGSRSTSA